MAKACSNQKCGVVAASALVSIAEVLLKMGCADQAQQTAISAAKLLKQHPSSPNVPVSMHAEKQLRILKVQVCICVEGSDLEGAKRYLQSRSDLCETIGIGQPGFVQRYDTSCARNVKLCICGLKPIIMLLMQISSWTCSCNLWPLIQSSEALQSSPRSCTATARQTAGGSSCHSHWQPHVLLPSRHSEAGGWLELTYQVCNHLSAYQSLSKCFWAMLQIFCGTVISIDSKVVKSCPMHHSDPCLVEAFNCCQICSLLVVMSSTAMQCTVSYWVSKTCQGQLQGSDAGSAS